LTTFTAAVGDNTYSFSTNSDVTVYANTGYTAANLAIYEGEIIQEAFLVSNTASNTQQFFINNFDVDVTSLMVKVRTSNTDSTNSEYTRANSLFGLSGSSNVYFVEPSSNGSYKVVFGNNTFGRQLANNNLVELTYRVSSGTDPNGANSFSADSVQGHPVAVSLVNRASNGDKFQDLDDVKFAAPRSLSVQERAVTSDDYATLVTNEFGDISSVYVYGGEEEETPQFGRVIIALRSEAYDVLPTQLKNQVSNFLKPKMPIGMRSTIKDPTFINIVLDVKVKYNRNATPKTPEEIQTLASSSIVTFNTDNLDKFDRTFRKSKLSKEVGNAHLSIESNEVNVKMTKDISPEVDTAFASTLKFNQELKIDNPIDEISQDAFQRYSTPTITSEVFKHDGITGASLRDNSAGVLQVVTVSNTDLTILNKNVGTVDYVKGEVKISGLVINTYASGATSGNIKVYAVPLDPDIVGKNEDVIRIRTSDTTVTVTELRL
tara:strand:- start:9238 stop:10707 length:1470 start_codon:yes stop_codon:yes gene_type:complete